MQWTTVQFWIVSLVTSTILPPKATKRFFSSSRSSDHQATRSTSDFQTAVIVFIPTITGNDILVIVADALLFLFKSATDQCYIFSNFFDDVKLIHVGSQNTPTFP